MVIVDLQQATYMVSEGLGQLSVCANLAGTAERDVLVTLSTMQLQGAAEGKINLKKFETLINLIIVYNFVPFILKAPDDYTQTTAPLTFLPGENLQCANISIFDDAILESNEDFSVQLNTQDTAAVTINLNSASVTITDNDGEVYQLFPEHNIIGPLWLQIIIMYLTPSDVTAGLQQSAYLVGEGVGSQSICTGLSDVTQREVIVTISTVPGTAQGIHDTLTS